MTLDEIRAEMAKYAPGTAMYSTLMAQLRGHPDYVAPPKPATYGQGGFMGSGLANPSPTPSTYLPGVPNSQQPGYQNPYPPSGGGGGFTTMPNPFQQIGGGQGGGQGSGMGFQMPNFGYNAPGGSKGGAQTQFSGFGGSPYYWGMPSGWGYSPVQSPVGMGNFSFGNQPQFMFPQFAGQFPGMPSQGQSPATPAPSNPNNPYTPFWDNTGG